MPASSRHDLFAVAPDEFVAARDELVRELRAAGDKDEAAAIKKLRRPAVPVWALNQVARSDAGVIEELRDAAAAARSAQDNVLGGADADELRNALGRRREAIKAVSRAARGVVDESGRSGDAQERDIENALNAVVGSERLAAELGRGELAGIDAGNDDDVLGAFASSADTGSTRTRAPARREPSRQLVAAREKLDRHRDEAADAAEQLRAAEMAGTHAAAALKKAERDLDAARRASDRADQAVERAEEAVARLEE
jgi:hypothetical protein